MLSPEETRRGQIFALDIIVRAILQAMPEDQRAETKRLLQLRTEFGATNEAEAQMVADVIANL